MPDHRDSRCSYLHLKARPGEGLGTCFHANCDALKTADVSGNHHGAVFLHKYPKVEKQCKLHVTQLLRWHERQRSTQVAIDHAESTCLAVMDHGLRELSPTGETGTVMRWGYQVIE